MKNEYLDNMVFKPDYVVYYDEQHDNYHGEPFKFGLYKQDRDDLVVKGWAASKSHPSEPVQVIVVVNKNHAPLHYYTPDERVHVYKVTEHDSSPRYTSKHDLFIYTERQTAVFAGKEMALYDSIGDFSNTCKDKFSGFSSMVKQLTSNPFFRYYYDKFADRISDLLESEVAQEARRQAQEAYEKAKEATKSGYQTAKDAAKAQVDKLLNEMPAKEEKKQEKTSCGIQKLADEIKAPQTPRKEYHYEREACTLIKHVGNTQIILTHALYSGNVSKYYIQIDNAKIVEITKEQFHNVLDVIEQSADEKPENVMNSIYDAIDMIVHHVNENNLNKPAKKNLPIQIVEFRKEDSVPQESLFKRKFTIGDSVRVTRGFDEGCEGVIVRIDTHTNENSGKKTLFYIVKFHGGMEVAYKAHYLEKINNVQVEDVGELYRRLDEQAKLITELQSTVNTLQNKKSSNKK